MGLYSDLDDFIKSGGPPEVEKDVENEGNIPQGDPDANPNSDGNIEPQSSSPEPPNREGNIEPSERSKDNVDRGSIPVSENAPEPPQHTGNIQPTEFDPESDGSPIKPDEENQPESPRTKNNIRPDKQNRPENPNHTELEPKKDSAPDGVTGKTPEANSDNTPEPPQQSGNIQPTQFDPQTDGSSIEAEDENQPETPRTSGNISPEEQNRPENSNQINLEPKKDSAPDPPTGETPEADDDSAPEPPNRQIINLREAAAPEDPQNSGNISSEDSKPREARKRGNIQPTEEPPSTEPMESSDMSVSAEPDQIDGDGELEAKDRRPQAPEKQENIQTEEAEKEPPQRSGNIQSEKAEKEPPTRSGNIPEKSEQDPRPLPPNKRENIQSEKARPGSPNRSENIPPEEDDEERRPRTPNRDENIPDKKEQDPRPPSPNREENIDEKTEQDPRPPTPNRDENIPEKTEQDPRPPTPNLDENIPDKKEEDPRPPSPNREGNIPKKTEENPQPEVPRREGNIPEEIEEEVEPPSVNRSGVIQLRDENQPLPPQKKGNIGQDEEIRSQRKPFLQTDTDQDPESPKQNRFQPVGLEASPYLNNNYTDTDESGNLIGSTSSVPEWEVPLKHQPQGRFQSQIDSQSSQFREGIGEQFPGEGDGLEEWEVPLRHHPKRFADQINPEDASFTDGIGGNEPGEELQSQPFRQTDVDQDPQSPKQNRYQPVGLEISPYLGEAYTDTDTSGEFIGNVQDTPEWQVPLKHQIRFRRRRVDRDGDLRGEISQRDYEFRDGIGPEFPGEGDGLGEWEVPLRHQPERYADQISPKSVEFRDGIGLVFPGEGDGIAEWEVSPLRHNPNFPDEINPANEGGNYQLKQFVAGSNEPGDNIRDMRYDTNTAVESLRFQTPLRPKLYDERVIDPAEEGGRYQLEEFVAGSDEPGDNIRDMGYSFARANAPLQYQPKIIRQKLRDSGVIDSSDEGGKYQLEKFVAGSNEPGDQIPAFESVGGLENESPFNAESSHSSNNNGPILNPAFNTGASKQIEFTRQNERVSVITDRAFPRSEDGVEERNEPLEFQSNQLDDQINPRDVEFRDGIGEQFPGEGDGVAEWEVSPLRHNPNLSDNLEDGNEVIRLQEFEEKFDDGRTELALGDTPIPRSGLSVPNVGTKEPYILRKPESGGGSAAIANAKQADSRIAPVGSAVEDTVRISKFFASGKGITYNIKQQFLQSQNPRKRTRIYDPTAPIQTSASGMATRPGQQITRHLGADSGPAGIVGDAAESIGFDVPSTSRYIDEINEESIETEYGEMRGSLFWLSPVATQPLPEITGEGARSQVQNIRSGNVQNITPLFSTEEQENLAEFAASQIAGSGGIGNGYLFTNSYDPQGGPDSEGTEEIDNYHRTAPYIQNVGLTGSRFNPDSLSYVTPEFNQTYTPLVEENENERDDQGSFFPYANPEASPEQDNVENGDGEVQGQIQNDFTSEVYYENRAFGDRLPLHRGVPEQEESRGLPNYSVTNEDGEKTKRIDWINRLEPIIGEDADPDTESYGGDGRHSDLIPFQFYDIENEALLVFRAFLEGISDSMSPEWTQQDYAGRPEQGHIYGGYSSSISFSFQAAPGSEEEFKAIWKKVNYLKGMTTPSSYSGATGGGAYMTPPFMRLTIGDMFNDVYGYLTSLTISVNDDMDWELDKDVGRLPKGIEIDVDWQVIKKRAPLAGQKFYDAPFLDEIENPVERESPEAQPEVELPTADDPVEDDSVDNRRAFELTNEEP